MQSGHLKSGVKIESNNIKVKRYILVLVFVLAGTFIVMFGLREVSMRNAVSHIRENEGIVATLDQAVGFGRRFSDDHTAKDMSDPICFAFAKWKVVKVRKSETTKPDIRRAIELINPSEVILLADSVTKTRDVLDSLMNHRLSEEKVSPASDQGDASPGVKKLGGGVTKVSGTGPAPKSETGRKGPMYRFSCLEKGVSLGEKGFAGVI